MTCPGPKPGPMDERLLVALWPTWLPSRILEIRLGRPTTAIYRRANRLGLPRRRDLRDRLYGVTIDTIKTRARKAKRREASGKDCHA